MSQADTIEHKQGTTLPGDMAMWFIILAELSVFAILFVSFSVAKVLNPELFLHGQSFLDVRSGLLITISLISASYFVAQGVIFFKTNKKLHSVVFLVLAVFSALIYIVIKLWEYQYLNQNGFGLTGNKFFALYFLITGFHLLHVVLGVGILCYIILCVRSISLLGFETSASYWHMVDLVWLLLFPLLYLVK